MPIQDWWPLLRPQTQQWLIANNGDAVPAPVVEEIAAAGGPAPSDSWWVELDGSRGCGMPDEAVDWVEAVANGE